MKLAISLNLRQLIRISNSVRQIEVKRRDGLDLEVVFYDIDNNPTLLPYDPADIRITFGAKPVREYAEDYAVVAFTGDWTFPTAPDDFTYRVSPSFNTIPLEALFEETTPERVTVDLMGEVSFWHKDFPDSPTSTRDIKITVLNDIVRGDENPPVNLTIPWPDAPVPETLLGGPDTGNPLVWIQRTWAQVWDKFIANASLLFPWSRVSGTPTTLAGYGVTAVPASTLTGTIDNARFPADTSLTNLTVSGNVILSGTAQYGGSEIANQTYVTTQINNAVQGLDPKNSVVTATTANITLSGTQTIDGIALVAGNRVLVKNQSTSAQNGIYVVAAGAWSRSTDADTWDELVSAFVFVERGTVNSDTGWTCTVNSGGTLGSTAVTWAQFSGAGSYTAGTGLTLSGTQFALTGQALALHNLSSNGIVVRTGSGTFAARTITAGTNVSITDGNGVANNPVVNVPSASTSVAGVTLVGGTNPAAASTIAQLDARVADTLGRAALVFDGSGKATSPAVLPGASSHFFCFFRTTATSVERQIISSDVANGGSGTGITIGVNGATGKVYAYRASPLFYVQSTRTVNTGEWFSLIVLFSGSQLFFYINGELDSTHTASVGTLTAVGIDLGGGTTSANYFLGQIVRGQVGNYLPDAAERAELIQNLGVPRPTRVGGGVTPVFSWEDGTSTIDVGLGFGYIFNNYGGTFTNYNHTTDPDGIGPAPTGTRSLKLVAAPGDGVLIIGSQDLKHHTHVVTFKYFVPVGQPDLALANVGVFQLLSYTGLGSVKGAWTQITCRWRLGPEAGINAVPLIRPIGGGIAYFDDVQMWTETTLYLQPDADAGAGPVMRARSGSDTILPGNGHNTNGVVRAVFATGPFELVADISGASGNSFILGVDTSRIPSGYSATGQWVYTPPGQGAANIFTGTSSGGNQISTSTAVSAGNTVPVTLANPQPVFSDVTRFYLNRSATLNAGSKLITRFEKVS